MLTPSKTKRKNTQSDKALMRIQNAIVDGELRPNQRLLESQLSAQLKMSRTPVREAIIRLQAMGLLNLLPGGGIAVAENTPKQLKDIFEIREVLESLVAKDFCEHAPEKQISKAEEYNRLSGEAARNNNLDEYGRYFTLFHDAILEGCSNEILVTLVRWTRDLLFERRIASVLSINEILRAVKKRETGFEAYRQRNSVRAQKLVKEYIRWQARVSQRL